MSVEVVLALAMILYLVWAFWPPTAAPGTSPGRPSGYIVEKARSLGFDPKRIISFVDSQVATDTAYTGVLRGALGTLWSGAGSDDDRAVLLQALLQAAHRPTRLVLGRNLGVESDLGAGMGWAGPGPPQAGVQPVGQIPASLEHTMDVALVTVAGDGTQHHEELGRFATSELSDQDLVLSYAPAGQARTAILAGPGGALGRSNQDASTATSQTLVFTVSGSGSPQQSWQRQLFTTADSGYPSSFAAQNRFTIAVSTGFVPGYAASRETDLSHVTGPAAAAAAHATAYHFLGMSDAQRGALAKEAGVGSVDVVTPRILIVGDMAAGGAGRTMTLDLRADTLVASGPASAQVVFNEAHSVADASTEADAVGLASGAAVTSSADALASALGGSLVQTPTGRVAVLSSALQQLVSGSQTDGDNLTVAPAGVPADSITWTLSGSTLKASATKAVLAGLHGPATALLPATVTSDNISAAAQDADALLQLVSRLPFDHANTLTFAPAVPAHFYDHALLLSYSADTLRDQVEPQVAEDGSLTFDITNYFNLDGTPSDPPNTSTITVDATDAASSHNFTEYYRIGGDDSSGRTWGTFSRQVLRELQQPSGSIVTWQDDTGKISAPLQLWAYTSREETFRIDGRPVHEPVLEVAGDFVSNHPHRPQASSLPPARLDDHDTDINHWTVVDDPRLPYLLASSSLSVQSAVSGRVTDATTGLGVPGATVSFGGASATTFPDGRFSMPLLNQPFGVFQIATQAPGYADTTVSRDLRDASALPLQLSLQPATTGTDWAVARNASDVSGLALDARESDLLTTELQGGELEALVPRGALAQRIGAAPVWVLFDPSSGETVVESEDGLHGAGTAGPGGIPGFTAALQCAYLESASAIGNVADQIGGGSGAGGGGGAGGAQGAGGTARQHLTEAQLILAGVGQSALPDAPAGGLLAQAGQATGAAADEVPPTTTQPSTTSQESVSGGSCAVQPGTTVVKRPTETPGPKPWEPVIPIPPLIGTVERQRRKCACRFATVTTETSSITIALTPAPDPTNPTGNTPAVHALQRCVGLVADAVFEKHVSVNGVDLSSPGATSSGSIVVRDGRPIYTWQVVEVTMAGEHQPDPPPVVRWRGPDGAPDTPCVAGAVLMGSAVVLVVDVPTCWVDWLEGSSVMGRFVDLHVTLDCQAVGDAGKVTRRVAVVLSNRYRPAPRPTQTYDVQLVDVTGPQAAGPTSGDAAPAAGVPVLDPANRSETCQPVAQRTRVTTRLQPLGPAKRQVKAGESIVIDANARAAARWTIRADDPSCTGPIVTIDEHDQVRCEFSLMPTKGPAPVTLHPLGRDSCLVSGLDVQEPTSVSILVSTDPPSGGGPLGAERSETTAGSRVTGDSTVLIVEVLPRRLRLALQDDWGAPLANRRVKLSTPGRQPVEVVLAADGMLDQTVSPAAATGTLEVLTANPEPVVFELTLDDLYRVDSHTGTRSRLNNLGFAAGPESGAWDADRIRRALERFQTASKLFTSDAVDEPDVSGVEDAQTRQALEGQDG